MAYVNTRWAQAGLVDRGVSMAKRIEDYMRRRAVYRQTLRELSGLTDRDLADLGLHRLSIEDVARSAAFGK